jgi:hypothetical protein
MTRGAMQKQINCQIHQGFVKGIGRGLQSGGDKTDQAEAAYFGVDGFQITGGNTRSNLLGKHKSKFAAQRLHDMDIG